MKQPFHHYTNNISNEQLAKELKEIIEESPHHKYALVRFAIERNVSNTVIFGRIDFLFDKDPLPEKINYPYGDFVLTQFTRQVSEIPSLLLDLGQKKPIQIESVGEVTCDFGDWQSYVMTSNKSHGYVKSDYPLISYSAEIKKPDRRDPYLIVTGKNLPPYSNTSRAIIDFLGLDNRDLYSVILNSFNFLINVPNFKAKIQKMKIMREKIRLELECKAIKENEIFAQFRIDGRPEIEIQVKNQSAEVNAPKNPKEILAVILEKKSNEVLDYIDYTFRWTDSASSIEKEIPEDVVRQWIDGGENEYVEFKEVLKHSDDVMKSIVAFANTDGGVILLGVKDDCSIIGYDESLSLTKGRLERMVAEKCDPPIKFEIEQQTFDDKKVTVIKIPKGTAKIYAVTNGPIYVRRGGSDRFIKPSEFTDVLENNKNRDSTQSGFV